MTATLTRTPTLICPKPRTERLPRLPLAPDASWEVRDERGRAVEAIPSRPCGCCGTDAPLVFLSGGVCPECAG